MTYFPGTVCQSLIAKASPTLCGQESLNSPLIRGQDCGRGEGEVIVEELSLRVSSQLQGSQLGVPSRVGLHYLSDGIKINHHKAHPLSISYPNLHVNKWGLGIFRELIASPELSPLRKAIDLFKTKFKSQISKQNREKVLPIRCLQRKRYVCPKKPRAQVRVRNLYYLAEDTPERWGKLSVPTCPHPYSSWRTELVFVSAQLCPPFNPPTVQLSYETF